MPGEVALRPLMRTDLPTVHRRRNDPPVTRHLARRTMSLAEIEAWFDGLEQGDGEARAIMADGELAAETFARAWRKRAQYRADLAAFSTWLFTIARNLATDYARRHRPGTRPNPVALR